MNARLQMRLLKKPAAPAPMPKPVYPRVPIFGGVVDRRADWRRKWEARESELLRARCIQQSAEVVTP